MMMMMIIIIIIKRDFAKTQLGEFSRSENHIRIDKLMPIASGKYFWDSKILFFRWSFVQFHDLTKPMIFWKYEQKMKMARLATQRPA